MQALVYTRPLTLEVLEVPDPVPAPGEVLVAVRTVGICGSEIEGVRSASPFRVPPLVMGHEFAGVRTDTGDAVAVNPIISCRACDRCLQGRGNICRARVILGITRAGAFAEQCAVPARSLHALPAGLSWAQAALVEPLANAVHAWHLVAGTLPARVGVLGAGTIGLLCLQVARRLGGAEVDVADLAADRLDLARTLGAARVGHQLAGEYDVVVDAVGAAATRQASLARLAPGGHAVWLGLHEADPGFDALAVIRAEQCVHGSFAYTDPEFARAVELVGDLTTDWVGTRPLRDGATAFAELLSGQGAAVKVQLVPGAPGPS